jgi:hypothetical protein
MAKISKAELQRELQAAGLVVEGDETMDELLEARAWLALARIQRQAVVVDNDGRRD